MFAALGSGMVWGYGQRKRESERLREIENHFDYHRQNILA